jgi:hypothetical protein
MGKDSRRDDRERVTLASDSAGCLARAMSERLPGVVQPDIQAGD